MFNFGSYKCSMVWPIFWFD